MHRIDLNVHTMQFVCLISKQMVSHYTPVDIKIVCVNQAHLRVLLIFRF